MPHSLPHRVVHNPHLAYRPDIDGLRALAIVAVILFHAFPQLLPGGFVGVDIFFVISGYLITSIILKAQSGDGFSLLEFYSHRIKRIFPALIVVLTFCLVVGWYILLGDEYKALGKHVAAGAAYVSNFILKGEAGYFDIAIGLKPLLHLWSLGIEEQFYLVWPLLLILALRWNLNPLAIIVLISAISFLLNVAYIVRLPVQVFYMPISRAWELLIGAILAYINLYKRDDFDRIASNALLRNPHQISNLSNLFAWTGVALIALAMVGLNKSNAFPGWWALFPTIGAVCLIAAGDQSWFNKNILSSNFMVYIGIVSYPLYLWHWPLLSFSRIVEGGAPTITIRLAVVVLSALLAWATYWLVEKQLRFRPHWSVAIGLIIALTTVGAIGYQIYRQGGYPDRYPQAEQVARNVGMLWWDNHGLNRQTACIDKFGKGFGYCEINDITKPPTVVLLGDSNANHFYPGLAKAYAKTNDNLLNLGRGGCPPLFGVKVANQDGDLECEDTTAKALNYAIESKSVRTVLLSMLGAGYATGKTSIGASAQNLWISYPNSPEINSPLSVLEKAMRTTLHRLTNADKQVIFVFSVPMMDFDPANCVDYRPWRITPAHIKTVCATPQKVVEDFSEDYRKMMMRVLREFPNVKVWDSYHELCDGKDCWAMKNGVLLYRDPAHLSEAGSLYIGERFLLHDPRKNVNAMMPNRHANDR